VIVTQSQCEVCAVDESDVEAAVAEWLGARPHIVSLRPYALADVFADMTRVAIALGARERGEHTVAALRARMDVVAERARVAKTRPTFACIEWIEPMMSAGNWMPELVGMAGGTNLFGRAGEHSPWMKIEELAARDPEVIMVSPCGFPMERSRRELPALSGTPLWNTLRAVRDHKVFLADGNQYFNRVAGNSG
jgi:iron complex transport system substrate-binding protein